MAICRIRKRNNFERRCYGFLSGFIPGAGPHCTLCPCRGLGGRRTGRRRSLHMRGSGALLAERLKKPLSRRIILAIKGRQCVLDSFSDVFPSDRCKKPLSGRIIPVIEGCQCLPERINRRPVERRDRDQRVTNFMVSAGLPGRGVFFRLNRSLSELRNYRLRLAFIAGAGSEEALSRRRVRGSRRRRRLRSQRSCDR